jgi:hypothetical protein
MALKTSLFTVCSLLFVVCFEARATTIYKSVDAQGRVSFSDQPPAGADVVDVYEYHEPPPSRSALDVDRIEAMREVTERMAADRREREASRARARANRQAQAGPDAGNGFYPQEYRGHDYKDYGPGFFYGYRPAVFPRRRHRPGGHPPIAHPPIAHPPVVTPPLERPADSRHATRLNQYPASLIRSHYTSAARRVFYGASRQGN